ncbi:flavin reductase family protein [Yunchengibacter salinarum]|uniref:flavin reductase family protein n=1 Tax=Yunchengibacter salinarum TaxID=3133399 RepID=UPI0035B669B9
MPVSEHDFKLGMRRLGGAVTIVTTAHNGVQGGLTATAVTSLSAQPPRLLACINRQGGSYGLVSNGRVMAVNVLAERHQALAECFAGLDDTPESDRFRKGAWRTGALGVPVLSDALVAFECRVESILDVGSHGVVIGSIEAVTAPEKGGAPLCYMDGGWAHMVPRRGD